MARGRFIAISGGEGSGKTSVLAYLRTQFPDFVYTREPGGTPIGEAIRAVLLGSADEPRPETELLLFHAARAEHVARVIEPALARGATVITDRYWPDSFAYQWFTEMGRTDAESFLRITDTLGFPRPDLWVWLDVDPAVGLARRRAAGGMNRIDSKDLAFHTSVRAGFLRLAESGVLPRTERVDAAQPFPEVCAAVSAALAAGLESRVV